MVLQNFIVFEGIDGAGTTTQQKLLSKKLENKKVFFTAEPTTGETGIFLRRVLKGEITLHPQTVARLFAADRSEHVYGKNGILELCQKQYLVVSDRYFFSSLAYQTPECGKELPRKLNEDFPLPEYIFYFVISPSQSLKRITGRGVTEIYEKQEFLEKTALLYEEIFKEYERAADSSSKTDNMKIITIDATLPPEEIEKIIWSTVSKMPIQNM